MMTETEPNNVKPLVVLELFKKDGEFHVSIRKTFGENWHERSSAFIFIYNYLHNYIVEQNKILYEECTLKFSEEKQAKISGYIQGWLDKCASEAKKFHAKTPDIAENIASEFAFGDDACELRDRIRGAMKQWAFDGFIIRRIDDKKIWIEATCEERCGEGMEISIEKIWKEFF